MSKEIQTLSNVFFLVVVLLVTSTIELASQDQDKPQTVINSKFEFNEGVYANFEEFKNNKPSKEYSPVILSPTDVKEYLTDHTSNTIISSSGQYIWVGHFTTDGEFKRIPPDTVWGLSKDNKIIIKHSEYLVEVKTIGAICHFSTADALFMEDLNISNEHEFIFEFETGKLKRFKRDNFMSLLSNDMELYQEFLQQDSYKKMKESMFDYLLRYNKRHPISFPAK